MDISGWINRETIRKPWINENKERKPCDTFYRLKVPNSNLLQYRTTTEEMANIATDHHNDLQKQGLCDDTDKVEADEQEVLAYLENRLSEDRSLTLDKGMDIEDVRNAIHHLPNGTSPGLDSLSHEFWKALLDRHDAYSQAKKEAFDPALALHAVFNNIIKHGTPPGSKFAEGWMCPLYKKNDRTDIGNYRPITVLNTDYKIYTTILSIHLAKVAPSLINPDQAGFMPGRHIEDQTDLIQLLINKCELTKDNGAIVFLDQEKAYDKIRHDYLWKVLDHLNFPTSFIKAVKATYKNAYTQVLINGILGTPFKITRGVRQGDPLSCLLFNLAIEPLACMLRASPLEGFHIRGRHKHLITTLFTDDTSVFLSSQDDPAELDHILHRWCATSGAKFNINKSVYLPVGCPDSQREFICTCRLNPNTTPIPDNILIVDKGQHTRVLRAYVGNGADQIAIWTPGVEKIEKNLARWARGKPTQEGRHLIANMEVGGRTQYLTRVQPMPEIILTHLNRILSAFVWDDHHPSINSETLRVPVRLGGHKLLNVQSRNKVIELHKYQRYCLSNTNSRPACAYVADEILRHHILKYNNIQDDSSIVHPPLQKFEMHMQSRTAPPPPSLSRMLKTKSKYNVIFDPPALSEAQKGELPIWYHIGENPPEADENTKTRRVNWNNLKQATCICNIHNVQTVQDTVNLQTRLNNTTHSARKNCKCNLCKEDVKAGCRNPHLCIKKSDELLDRLTPKFRPTPGGPPQNNTANNTHEGNDAAQETNDAHEGDDNPQGADSSQTSTNPQVDDPPDNNNAPEEINLLEIMGAGKALFNKNTSIDTLDEGFRVFGGHTTTHHTPMIPGRLDNPPEQEAPPTILAFTDGSCEMNGTMQARAGSRVWYGPNDERNVSARLPPELEQSNNTGELVAILIASINAEPSSTLEIRTDSKYAIDSLTSFQCWREREGWIGVSNKKIIKKIIAVLKERKGKTYLSKVKGHSGDTSNNRADEMA